MDFVKITNTALQKLGSANLNNLFEDLYWISIVLRSHGFKSSDTNQDLLNAIVERHYSESDQSIKYNLQCHIIMIWGFISELPMPEKTTAITFDEEMTEEPIKEVVKQEIDLTDIEDEQVPLENFLSIDELKDKEYDIEFLKILGVESVDG